MIRAFTESCLCVELMSTLTTEQMEQTIRGYKR
jgi:hypothetical protein